MKLFKNTVLPHRIERNERNKENGSSDTGVS